MNSANEIGAFFDLDGTLLAPPSLESRFVAYLLERKEVRSAGVLRWLWCSARAIWRGPRAATEGNKFYLAGLCESLASEWANSRAGSLQFRGHGMERLAWHVSQGHHVFLASGTLAGLAGVVARGLPGRIEVAATELEVCGGYWTGRLSSAHRTGREKARALVGLTERYGLRLGGSYAYGNEISDLAMLECVGHPSAVNPDHRLERAARSRGWPVCDWRDSSTPQLEFDAQTRLPGRAR
jgi:phosphoserine phosphatase